MLNNKSFPKIFGAVLVYLTYFVGSAVAQCGNIPRDVERFLHSEPAWALVDIRDLVPEDQVQWNRKYDNMCPGLASVDLDGNGKLAYALALVQKRDRKLFEKLIVLRRDDARYVPHTLHKPSQVSIVFVTYRVPASTAHDYRTEQNVTFEHDAIGYEEIDSTIELYYWKGGKFHMLVTAD